MHCLAGLDTLTSGQVFLGETELGVLSDRELTALRRERVGFVFQSFNLMPTLTAWENITLPFALAGRDTGTEAEWIDVVVSTVGLGDRLRHRPVGAVRWAAAARRHRQSAGHPARSRVRRRADGQPRLDDRRRGARVPPRRRARHGPDRRHGHPRPGGRRLCRRGRVPRRRADRRRDGHIRHPQRVLDALKTIGS